VAATGAQAIDIFDDDGFFWDTVYVSETGNLTSADRFAVVHNASGLSLTNDGEIRGMGGLRVNSDDAYITNNGYISGGFSIGADIAAETGMMTNHGTISASSDGPAVNMEGLSNAPDDLTYVNYGLTQVFGDPDDTAVRLDNAAFVNAGLVVGAVVGDNYSSTEIVENDGTIDGAVDLRSGDDVYAGLGSVRSGVDGGSGVDTLDFSDGSAAGWVDLSASVSRIWTMDQAILSGGDWRFTATVEDFENINGSVGVDVLRGDDGDNTFGYQGDVVLQGIEQIVGNGGYDTIDFSGFGSAIWIDLEYGGSEVWTRDSDTYSGGGSFRAIANVEGISGLVGTMGVDFVRGTAGDNHFVYNGSAEYQGVEDIDLRGGTDRVDFGNFESALWIDLAYASGAQAQTQDLQVLSGGAWREVASLVGVEDITGTQWSDEIRGDNGANIINGGNGNDLLIGRGGLDTFVFEEFFDNDVIQGFDADDGEKIDLSALGNEITDFADLVNNHLSDVDGDATITVGSYAITLDGWTSADFGFAMAIYEDDFVFA
jgi:hypothetical protein